MTSIGPKEAQVRALKGERCGLSLSQHAMLAGGAPPALLRSPKAKASIETPRARPAKVNAPTEAELLERRIRKEADSRWRNWMPTMADRTRPTMPAMVKTVRAEFARSYSARVDAEAIARGAPAFLCQPCPAYAVACPDASCKVRIGAHCKRPSGHKAMNFHAARGELADALWLKFDLPTITAHRDGSFTYDGPETRPSVTGNQEATMTKRKTKGRKATRSTKPNAAKKANGNGTSKVSIVAGMLTRAGGCTAAEVLAATRWLKVSVPAMANAAGLKLTKGKDATTGLTRYRGVAA